MVVNDPIADMLTRIRNGQVARHDAVTMPASNTKKAIAKILLNEGYIKAVDFIDDGLQGEIKITLKYLNGKKVGDEVEITIPRGTIKLRIDKITVG